MANFSKILRKTDIQNRLSVPTKYLKSLPSFNGDHAVDFQATDERGHDWTFRCSIRRRRHPKPVLSTGWLAFVGSKNLKVGDKVKFYKVKNKAASTSTRVYKVRAEREIKIFGAVFGYAPVLPNANI